MKLASSNLLKDSFYKERLIKSTTSNMQNTLYRQSIPDSNDDLIENRTIITQQQQALDMKQHLSQFKKTSEGAGYTFVRFQCTHKMFHTLNVNFHQMQIIRNFQYLEEVDVSYNKLTSLKYLSGLKYLVKVIAANNELSSVLDVKEIPLHLDWLDVSNNKIQKISDLSKNKYLRVLNLKANSINIIEGINSNLNLQIVDLSENKIEQISGLDGLKLKELNLSQNLIENLKGMSKLESLRSLDLSINKICKLSGLVNLISLRNLKMAKNNVKNVREIDYLENLMYLSHLDLCFNPIQERRYYRNQLNYKLPMLQTLDGSLLTSDEVIKAEEFYGLYVQQKFNIFKRILPEEEFIDRRIQRLELLQNETDSEGQHNNFVDEYDEEGRVRSNSSRSKSKNKSFNGTKRSVFSRASKMSKKSSLERA